MSERPTIFADMDGVFWNFIDRANHVCYIPLKHNQVTEWMYFRPFISDKLYFDYIEAMGLEFWTEMRTYSWARRLFMFLATIGDVIFLSDPGGWTHAVAGKRLLVSRFLDMGAAYKMVCTKNKELLAKIPDSILIDDKDDNVTKFRKNGGRAILFPQPWNENKHLIQERLPYVFSMLEGMTNA